MAMTTAERPIGYWLKHLDGLFEAGLDRALADMGISRRHWQTMNVLGGGPQGELALADALRPFWVEGAITLDEVTAALARRGWVTRSAEGRYGLTESGEAAHAAVSERVQATRRAATAGLGADEYQATVRTLRRMAGNMEAALAAQKGGSTR
jgi:DNA-binding MarR family transcriptional regulator